MAAEFDEGEYLRRVGRELDNPQAALKQIGAFMVTESRASFRKQRFGATPWKPRDVPNVYGIIADFHGTSNKPPKRRFEATPALVDKGGGGGLKSAIGIVFKIVGKNTVEVGRGPQFGYADVLHHGGKIESLPITEQVQKKVRKFLGTKAKPGPGFKWRSNLGFLLNPKFKGKTLKGNVEARPFVGVTTQTIKDIREAIGVKIFEVR